MLAHKNNLSTQEAAEEGSGRKGQPRPDNENPLETLHFV